MANVTVQVKVAGSVKSTEVFSVTDSQTEFTLPKGALVNSETADIVFDSSEVNVSEVRGVPKLSQAVNDAIYFRPFGWLSGDKYVLADGIAASSQAVSVTSITRVTTTATVTTAAAHGLTTNDYVYIAGAAETDYNGGYQITVTDTTHFTYTVAGSPATPATGTITETPYTRVTTHAEANTAAAAATAGSVILFAAAGTWNSTTTIKANTAGASGDPIIWGPETTQITFTSASDNTFWFESQHNILCDTKFNGCGKFSVYFKSPNFPSVAGASYNRITGCQQLNGLSGTSSRLWALEHGASNNRVDHCLFDNFTGIALATNTPINGDALEQDNIWNYNTFRNVSGAPSNENMPIQDQQAGVAANVPGISRTIIEYNEFHDIDSQIFNLKASEVIFRWNVCRNMEQLSMRDCNDCEIYGNILINCGFANGGSIRIVGQRHQIHHNIIIDPPGHGILVTLWGVDTSPIYIDTGNNIVEHNTVIGLGVGKHCIFYGETQFPGGLPSTMLPHDDAFRYNLLEKSTSGEIFNVKNGSPTIDRNGYYATGTATDGSLGVNSIDIMVDPFERTYRLISGSQADDQAVGSTAVVDAVGRAHHSTPSIGAVENEDFVWDVNEPFTAVNGTQVNGLNSMLATATNVTVQTNKMAFTNANDGAWANIGGAAQQIQQEFTAGGENNVLRFYMRRDATASGVPVQAYVIEINPNAKTLDVYSRVASTDAQLGSQVDISGFLTMTNATTHTLDGFVEDDGVTGGVNLHVEIDGFPVFSYSDNVAGITTGDHAGVSLQTKAGTASRVDDFRGYV